MDGSESIGVYGEAKAEYTRQLCSFVVPALETYFLDLLDEVKATEKDPKRVLWVFQDRLKQFPDWNVDKVQRETERIQTATKCDYLEEILTAVFIAHTKVLSAIRLTSKQKKLQITIPKIDHFLHRTMSECARLLWSSAYLFSESGPSIERQKNLRQVGQLLHEGVLQSIRGMLPVKSILKEYLSEDTEETGEAVTQEEETAPVVHEATEEEKTNQSDLSGSTVPEPPAPEPPVQPEPPAQSEPPAQPEPPVQPEAVEQPEAPVQPAPPTPTIIVDTEPPTVGFTQMDTVFDTENPERNMIQLSNHDEDEQHEVTHIEVDTTSAPEAVEEYETLDAVEDELVVGEDEFETL